MTHRRTLTVGANVLLAAAVCAVYCRGLNSPFVFDDSGSVTRNRSIFGLWPPIGDAENPGPLNPPRDLPTAGRPLVNLSLALNYRFGQFDTVGYHIFNLIVHVLSALLLMAIVRRTLCLDYFGGRFTSAAGPLAFAVSLLWALHPLQTETVIYISQRTELMVGFFYLATLYASLRYWDANTTSGRRTWMALATLACLAGMACKEVMVTAPVIVLLFERTFIAGSFRRALRNSWPLYFGLFFSWGLLVGLNWSAPRSNTAGFHLGIPAYAWWLTQAKILWMYLKLTICPWPLALYYYIPYLTTLGSAWPWVLATAILAGATLVLCWRRTAIGFVGAWVLLILSPTLVVPIITEMAAERRMYLPLAALAALAVVGGYALIERTMRATATTDAQGKLASNGKPVAIVTTIALLLAIVLGSISFHRLAAYRDELTLWQDVLATQPKNFIAHYNLGIQLARENKPQEALEEYQEAIRLNPDYPDPHNNLGNILLAFGKIPEAIACYQDALRLSPDYARAHNNLGTALAQMGKITEAIDQYREAIRIEPYLAEAYSNWGKLLVKLNRPQEAAQRFQQALQYGPNDFEVHVDLAGVLISLGRFQEAYDQCQQALAIKPDYADAHCNLGIVLARLGKLPEAIAESQRAVQLDSNNFNAHYNLGNALFEAGQVPAAVEQFQKAIQINPDDPQVHYNLGNVLLQTGQSDAAIEQYQTAVKLRPDYAEAHNNLGSTLLRAGRPQEAIEQYGQAVQLMPNHPKAYYNLANAYAQMRRYSEAIAAAEKALDLARSSGQSDFAAQIEATLNNYRDQQAKRPGEATPTQRVRASP